MRAARGTDAGDPRDEAYDDMLDEVDLPRLCDPDSVDNYMNNDSGTEWYCSDRSRAGALSLRHCDSQTMTHESWKTVLTTSGRRIGAVLWLACVGRMCAERAAHVALLFSRARRRRDEGPPPWLAACEAAFKFFETHRHLTGA